MKKAFKTQEIRKLGTEILEVWEANKNQIKLSGKSLYNLIGIKKILEAKVEQIQDTITTTALSLGGYFVDNGGIKIPEENLDEVNKKLFDFGQEEIEIEYSEIILDNDNDLIPAPLLDIFYDFVTIN